MGPIDVQEELLAREEQLPDQLDEVGLTKFMSTVAKDLKEKYNFTPRQISWTIKIFLYERTIDSLLDELDELEVKDKELSESEEVNNIDTQIAKLEGKICIKKCYDQNFRINLAQALREANVPQEIKRQILIDICGFNLSQFDNHEDQIPNVSVALAPWLDDTEASDLGWQAGLSEEFDEIINTFGPLILSVLNRYLPEEKIDEIFDQSFNLNQKR